jgi:HYR domain
VKRLVLVAAAGFAFAAFPAMTFGDGPSPTAAPPITIDVPSPVRATDPSGVDVTYHVKSHLDPAAVVTCTPTGSGTDFGATFHFPPGNNVISCSDTEGNTATATVTVTYVAPPPDTTPPSLTLPPNITTEATSSGGALVTYSVSASDDSGSLPTVSCAPASGSTFPLGTTTVNCTATDGSGNSTNGSFIVKVQDTTAPSLKLPGDIGAGATSGSGAVVTYSASATDAVSGNVGVTCNPPSGSTFAIGTTTVNCSATDGAGNTANGSFHVAVGDTAGPTFSNLPGSITVEAVGPAGSQVNYRAPSASDEVDGPAVVTCAPRSGSVFPLGTTVVQCSATDAHGNTGTASFSVTVRDTTKPSLVIPSDYSVNADAPGGTSAQSHYPAMWLSQATATDLVDQRPRVSNNAPGFFTVGVHLVTFSASDASGNSVSKSATLEVRPMAPAGAPPPLPPVPPAALRNVTGLKADAGDGRVRLSWKIPAGVDHVIVKRELTIGGDVRVVYTGKGSSFTDRTVANGLEYRYVVISVSQKGDESAGAAVVALPKHSLLRSPKDGVRLRKPPKLIWERNSEASYYNVQLFRGEAKILSAWPTARTLSLKRTWRYKGKRYTLTNGLYRWYVWPGFGARANVNYGEMLGFSTFQILR